MKGEYSSLESPVTQAILGYFASLYSSYFPFWYTAYMRSKPIGYYRPKNWAIFIAAVLLWLLSRLPYRMMLAVGRGLGRLGVKFGAKNQIIIMRNLALCFSELSLVQRQELSLKIWQSHAIAALETIMAWWGSSNKLNSLLTVKGEQYLRAAQTTGRGIMLLGAHFTCLELQGRYVSQLCPFSCTAKHMRNPVVDYIVDRARLAYLKDIFYTEDLRYTIKNLREGAVVSFLLDQDYGKEHSFFAPFFGIQTATTSTIARIAGTTNSIVLPNFLFRNADNSGYTLEFFPPFENYPSNDPVADATRFNQIIEVAAKEHPEQYGWIYERFATRPEGEPKIYD